MSSEEEERYSRKHLRAAEAVNDLGRSVTTVYHTFGYDIAKRGNISFIEEDVIVYAVSNFVVFENIISGTRQYLRGLEDQGVGCVTIHPSKKMFAVGGVGYKPRIFIYTYPNMQVVKTLPGGAERGFATLAFNSTGNKLASVATSPDYMLTLWDWQEEAIGLHAKAFGQDVSVCRFSLDNELKLTTSGSGHIRFWKMASTFTGLKLQGSIGKFGKVELSDVYAFVELPDGKVLSGTDNGSLLLWEGNFVKCRFVLATGETCHNGEITYVEFDRKQKLFVTAGVDGYIKWWEFHSIDSAEVDSDVTMNFDIMPLGEFCIGTGRGIKTITEGGLVGDAITYVIHDTCGFMSCVTFNLKGLPMIEVVQMITEELLLEQLKLTGSEQRRSVDPWTYKSSHYNVRVIDSGNNSGIVAVDCCPVDHLSVTCSRNGTIRVYDYVNRREVAMRKFDFPCTCLSWVPLSIDGSGMSFVVGFGDGCLRVLSISKASSDLITIKLVMVIKPHLVSITDIAFSNSGSFLASASTDGNVFVLNCRSLDDNRRWSPVRFFPLKQGGPGGKSNVYCEKLSWSSENDNFILCSCSDKKAREAAVSELTSPFDLPLEFDTFLYNVPIRTISITQPSLETAAPNSPIKSPRKKDEKEKEDKKDEASYDVGVSIYSKMRSENGVLMSASRIVPGSQGGSRSFLFEGSRIPLSEGGTFVTDVAIGNYSNDGKESLKVPNMSMMKYSTSNRFLIVCGMDGTITLKPVKYFNTLVRTTCHNFLVQGSSAASLSFDDRFLISVGFDGVVSVTRVAVDSILSASTESLTKDIEAGVFGQKTTKIISSSELSKFIEPSYMNLAVIRNFEGSPIEHFPDDKESVITPKVDKSIIFYNNKPSAIDVDEMPAVAYCLEDEKLKAGEDNKKSTADIFKDRLKIQIKSMRKEFNELMRENNHLPDKIKLSQMEMNVDGDFWDVIKAESEAQIEEVHKESEFEYEKAMVMRQKVNNFFMTGLLMEEFKVTAFPISGEKVKDILYIKTLRTKGINEDISKLLASIKQIMKKERDDKIKAGAGEAAKNDILSQLKKKQDVKKMVEEEKRAAGIASGATKGVPGSPETDKENIKNGVSTARPGSTSHARRDARKQRKLELGEHQDLKPKDDEDDVRDISAILQAEKGIGDYKLKSSLDDYVIAEDQRTNANQKRQQMAMLDSTMTSMRVKFNEKVINLRALKKQIIESVGRDNARFRQIDNEIQEIDASSSTQNYNFELDPREYPDDRNEVSLSELDNYDVERKTKSWDKCSFPMNSTVVGNNSQIKRAAGATDLLDLFQLEPVSVKTIREERKYSVSSSTPNVVADMTSKNNSLSKINGSGKKYYEVDETVLKIRGVLGNPIDSNELKRARELECIVPALRATRFIKEGRLQSYGKNVSDPVAKDKCTARRKELDLEKSMKLKNIDKTLRSFNDAIIDLRVQRQSLVTDLKVSESKMLTLFREYSLLLTFESKDIQIQQRQLRCQAEKTEIVASTKEAKTKLDGRAEELKNWQNKAAQAVVDFSNLISETHVFYGPLLKIFKKKIRKNSNTNGSEDDEEDNDDYDDDDDDDEEVEDVCPSGCASELYEKVVEIRSQQADANHNTLDIQKNIEDLKKVLDRLKSREKQIIKDATAAEWEFNQFQLQKQDALNRIDVMVGIKLSQFYCFNGSGSLSFPTDRARPIDGPRTEENSHFFDAVHRLRDISGRDIVSHIPMQNYVYISRNALSNLDRRIGELHVEVAEAVSNFKELHHARGLMKKQRLSLQQDIEIRNKKVEDLQMLKFGRMVDLDDLEAGADKTKEIEAENQIKQLELDLAKEHQIVEKEIDKIQGELKQITTKNTALLTSVSTLMETKSKLESDLNNAIAGGGGTADVGSESQKEKEERDRILTYIKLQAKEIESLRAEIYMLRRKDAPPIQIPSLPLPVANSQENNDYSFLPPLARGTPRGNSARGNSARGNSR